MGSIIFVAGIARLKLANLYYQTGKDFMNIFDAWLRSSLCVACAALLCGQALAQGVYRTEIHSFSSVTLDTSGFLLGKKDGKPVTIAGELRIPKPGTDRLPAVVMVHGSGGIGFNQGMWMDELNRAGFATFILDSFTGRGITSTVTDQSQLSSYAMMNDAYAALALLAKHPRIDPDKIAVMGFSKGAIPSLYASMKRFQSAYAPEGASFAAYIGFYTPCNIAMIGDEEVSAKPIRLYHGIADDWVPIVPCRDYVARLKKAGANVDLVEYPGATHAFDIQTIPGTVQIPQAQTARKCSYEEKPQGVIVNRDTGQPATFNDACVERGVTIAYNAEATDAARKDVIEFLTKTFSR
jgi:dienelactone hydrolase